MFADRASEQVFNRIKKYYDLTKNPYHLSQARRRVRLGETYFDKHILRLTDTETYIDCGANQGHTIKSFISTVGGKYTKIYGYEPETELFNNLKFLFRDSLDIIISNKVLGERCGKAAIQKYHTFSGKQDTQFCPNDTGDFPMTSLDIDLGDVIPTLIKMDIEGMEQQALTGASNILRKCKPKLAIACYHNEQDIVEIPALLRSIQPDYNFYLRHYEVDSPASTILYAI